MKFFLSHPTKSRELIRRWQLEIQKKINIEILNPFYDQEKQEMLKKIGNTYRHNKTDQDLVEDDLKYLRKCDALIVYLDNHKTIGTYQEMMYAWILRLPIYTICTTRWITHPWLRYLSTKLFSSLSEFEKFITKKLN